MMVRIRERLAYQITREPERHRELVKQLERSRTTRSRRIKKHERKQA